MKKTINQIVIVEGKTDSAKLKKLFDVETLETNGSALDIRILNLIKRLANQKGIILFLDPDYMGEKIRKQIIEFLNKEAIVYDLHIPKNKAIDHKKHKIGIAQADDQTILEAFKNIKPIYLNNMSLSWNDYLDLDLNNKKNRLLLTNKLNISYANHKQLYKRLNMLSLKKQEILEILKNGN